MICMECNELCEEQDSEFRCSHCGTKQIQSEFAFNIPVINHPYTTREEAKEMRRSIQVTKLNIKAMPMDWVCMRYFQIQKCMDDRYKHEMSIIEQHLISEGKEDLIGANFSRHEQMELDIPLVMREQYVAIVELKLREYYLGNVKKEKLMNRIIAHRNQEVTGTKVVASYGERTGGMGCRKHSFVESSAIESADRWIALEHEYRQLDQRMYQMERALNELLVEQQQLIKAKYLVEEEPKDEHLAEHLKWSRSTYYRMKKVAIIRLATSLKVI